MSKRPAFQLGLSPKICIDFEEYTPRENEPTQQQRRNLRFLVDKFYGGNWHAMWSDFPEYDPYGYTRAEADSLIDAIYRGEVQSQSEVDQPEADSDKAAYGERALRVYESQVVEYLNLPPLTNVQFKRFSREFGILFHDRGADNATILSVFYRMIESMQQDPMYPDDRPPFAVPVTTRV